jgi:ABC-type transport system involved in multi-copper enzyme maturation permease subunit
MLAKRVVLTIISLLVGLAGTAGTLLAFRTDPEHFAWSNTFLLFVAFAVFSGVWLDYFLGTEILKS